MISNLAVPVVRAMEHNGSLFEAMYQGMQMIHEVLERETYPAPVEWTPIPEGEPTLTNSML